MSAVILLQEMQLRKRLDPHAVQEEEEELSTGNENSKDRTAVLAIASPLAAADDPIVARVAEASGQPVERAARVVAVGDGALGFWSALRDVFPKTREQRCWVHKIANVLDKLPAPRNSRLCLQIHLAVINMNSRP
jgi:hypothetical protein